MAALARQPAPGGETIGFFLDDVDALQVDYPNLHKFARASHEFGVYIAANTGGLINYGESISSCVAESTLNAVISKRFAKRQQMQRTKRGAHVWSKNNPTGGS
jgi:hypothetical protein